jgi:hypothetical protein
MKIPPMGAELFHADGQADRRTDMTKLAVAFRNFVKRIKTVHFAYAVHWCVLYGFKNK